MQKKHLNKEAQSFYSGLLESESEDINNNVGSINPPQEIDNDRLMAISLAKQELAQARSLQDLESNIGTLDAKLVYKEARRALKEAKRAVKNGTLTAVEANLKEKLETKRKAKAVASAAKTVVKEKQLTLEILDANVASIIELRKLSKKEEIADQKVKMKKKLAAIEEKISKLEAEQSSLDNIPITLPILESAREEIQAKIEKLSLKKESLESLKVKQEFRETNLTSKSLAKAKHQAHKYFDTLWQKRADFFGIKENKARRDAYQWLSKMLNIPVNECHMSLMDTTACEKTKEICIITLNLWSQVTHENEMVHNVPPPLIFSKFLTNTPTETPVVDHNSNLIELSGQLRHVI